MKKVNLSVISFDRRIFGQKQGLFAWRKERVPFSIACMAIGNVELVHERFPKHSVWEQQ